MTAALRAIQRLIIRTRRVDDLTKNAAFVPQCRNRKRRHCHHSSRIKSRDGISGRPPQGGLFALEAKNALTSISVPCSMRSPRVACCREVRPSLRCPPRFHFPAPALASSASWLDAKDKRVNCRASTQTRGAFCCGTHVSGNT